MTPLQLADALRRASDLASLRHGWFDAFVGRCGAPGVVRLALAALRAPWTELQAAGRLDPRVVQALQAAEAWSRDPGPVDPLRPHLVTLEALRDEAHAPFAAERAAAEVAQVEYMEHVERWGEQTLPPPLFALERRIDAELTRDPAYALALDAWELTRELISGLLACSIHHTGGVIFRDPAQLPALQAELIPWLEG